MSSTNRKNAQERHVSDYYVTPQKDISDFLSRWIKDEQFHRNYTSNALWRDPCAGGDSKHEMSYPAVLIRQFGVKYIETIDVRQDSLADVKSDYLSLKPLHHVDITITNPPFNVAQEVIEKALKTTRSGGYVIMLLRLNFLGSKSRKPFWDKYPAHRIYVHHKRMSFKDGGGTDSIEYAHFVWQVGKSKQETILKVI